MTDLNQLAQRVHRANKKWWTNLATGQPIERNRYELIALVISELSEALEGERKNLMDDKLPDRPMAEVEMADAYIRLLDYAGGMGIEITSEYEPDSCASNRGEAIFCIMEKVMKIPVFFRHDAHLLGSLGKIQDYCHTFNYDLWGALEAKLLFNETREDHTAEHRLTAHGKKF